MIRALIVGTRGSTLALRQAERVVDLLRERFPRRELVVQTVRTLGDRQTSVPLSHFGTTGVFVKELDQLVADGRVDIAVHSLKDVPPDETPGLVLAAFPERADPRDVLVARHDVVFNALPPGSRVGTSSPRRQAQLRAIRPDLDFRDDLRGNVETRLRKLRQGNYEAIVLAAAGLIRLDRAGEITEYLSVETCLPDAGQGTLVVSARAGDDEVIDMLSQIDDARVRTAATAERAVLTAFGGGCKVPVAAFATVEDRVIAMTALVATPTGSRIVRASVTGRVEAPIELGRALWQQLVVGGANDVLGEAARV